MAFEALKRTFSAARIARMNDSYPEAEVQLDECRRLLHGPTARTQLETVLLRTQHGEVDQVGDGLLLAAENGEADKKEVLEALARGYMRMMRYVSAQALLDRCLASYPDDVHALDWRGWLLERLGQEDEAARDYERASALFARPRRSTNAAGSALPRSLRSDSGRAAPASIAKNRSESS